MLRTDGRTSCHAMHTCRAVKILDLSRRDEPLYSCFNTLECKGNYSATFMTLVHWPLMGGLLYVWYSKEGTRWSRSLPRLLIAVLYVTAHLSTYQSPQCCIMVCCSVSVSDTFVNFVKTNKHIIKMFSPSGNHTILVFRRQTA